MSSDILRHAFLDICQGYSKGLVLDKECYIKHLSHADQLNLEAVEKGFYDVAKKHGLPTEEDRIKLLKKEGRWKDSDEAELEELRTRIESNVLSRKQAMMPSMLKRLNEQIEELEIKYRKKVRDRSELVALTCEISSQRRVNEHYIFQNLYSDPEFKNTLFSTEEFEDLSEHDMNKVIGAYNSLIEPCSDANIKKLAIQEFFQSYYYISPDDFSTFYGKPIWKLTLFQVKLANYAKYFKTIFENHDMRALPKDVLDDPDKITDWVTTTERAKRTAASPQDAAMGGVAGMTKEDRKALGIQKDRVDLTKEAAKSGGKLNREQLFQLMGVGK